MELVKKVAELSCSSSLMPPSVRPGPDYAHEEEAARQRAHSCPAIRQTSVCLKSDFNVTTKCRIRVCPCQQVHLERVHR